MNIKIIFEDKSLLVLDKPAGMIVNRADTTKDQVTVQDWVEKYLKIRSTTDYSDSGVVAEASSPQNDVILASEARPESRVVFASRAGIVHRLDKETSGILLVAKILSAFINLQSQFKERKVKKTYIALAHGEIDPKEGEINVAVGRLPWNRKKFGVLSGGRESVTKYKVLGVYKRHSGKPKAHPESDSGQARMTDMEEPLSLVELYPKTGRTHQIRVHLQYIHHPIFADPLYAGRKTSIRDRKLLSRIFLHASKISFFHPAKNEIVNLESPLPEDLKAFINIFAS